MSSNVNYFSRGASLNRAGVSTQYDALVVFEAARRGIIHVMRHRLADTEKDIHISPGSVYVWEEAHASDRSSKCLRRWTDGVKWSQSRMREPFLYYEEVPPFERTEIDRANKARHPSRRDRIIKPGGLKKLTFSSMVCMEPGDPQDKWAKWHLVCYMSPQDKQLPHISTDPLLANIDVPDGVYFDGKFVPLDNTPRNYSWQRPELSPPHSDRETPLQPMLYPQDQHMHNAPMAPLSPPASPRGALGISGAQAGAAMQGHYGHSPAAGPSSYHHHQPSYHPLSTPPHIATAAPPPHSSRGPVPNVGPARPAPPHSHSYAQPQHPHAYAGQYSPSHTHSPQHPRLPPVSEVLSAHYPDLDADHCGDCARVGPVPYVQLPPPNLDYNHRQEWSRRGSEDEMALRRFARGI